MTVARVSMLEFKSEDNMETFINIHKTRGLAELGAETHCITQTGPLSFLVISTYADEAKAEETQTARVKYKESVEYLLDDYFFYEGAVKLHIDSEGNEFLTGKGSLISTSTDDKLESLQQELGELKEMVSKHLLEEKF